MVKTKINNVKSLKPKEVGQSRIQKFKSDTKETAVLLKAGKKGASLAIRESKALGLTITYLENGILYKEYADGTKEVIQNSKEDKLAIPSSSKKNQIKFKKGMILHAKN
jgi:hypothetical protein